MHMRSVIFLSLQQVSLWSGLSIPGIQNSGHFLNVSFLFLFFFFSSSSPNLFFFFLFFPLFFFFFFCCALCQVIQIIHFDGGHPSPLNLWIKMYSPMDIWRYNLPPNTLQSLLLTHSRMPNSHKKRNKKNQQTTLIFKNTSLAAFWKWKWTYFEKLPELCCKPLESCTFGNNFQSEKFMNKNMLVCNYKSCMALSLSLKAWSARLPSADVNGNQKHSAVAGCHLWDSYTHLFCTVERMTFFT